jgi:acyl-coenzyme A thioesterase PaaI-like protein
MTKRQKLMAFIRFWGPYRGSGIYVTRIDEDFRTVEVELRMKFYNRNYVGTHYGGSLYSMCDPFYMIMLIENLGPGYIVWDKAATIRFKRPGRGTVKTVFRLTQERIDEIRALADSQEKVEPTFQLTVTDAEGKVVAEVDKLLYVKKKT